VRGILHSPATLESESASDVKKSWLGQPQRRQQMLEPEADGRGRQAVEAFQGDGRAQNAKPGQM
jgi:hypothetical protein